MNRLFKTGTAVLAVLLGTTAPGTATPPPAVRDTIPPALSSFEAEHGALLAGFGAALRRAVAPAAGRAEREAFVRFLRGNVIAHAQVEERVLYAALERVLGTHGYATATMILDHRAIARMTVELAALATGEPGVFQEKAFAVAALVEHHFALEEDFVLPTLATKMSERELLALLARMDAERLVP